MSDTTDPKPDDPPEPQPPSGPRKDRRSGMTPTPHDALFRALTADPVRARALLRDHMPNDIAGRLADTPPRIIEGTFVDEALRGSQSDLLMEVETETGNLAFLYVLVEHKSTPDPGVVLQVASYMIRIWQRHAQGRAERFRALPPIIPLVGYSGSAPWTVPTELSEMMATDDPALRFMDLRVVLRQWARMSPEALSRDPELRAGLVTLTGQALEEPDLVAEGVVDNDLLMGQIMLYIAKVYVKVKIAEVLVIFGNTVAARKVEGFMETIEHALKEEGRAEGVAMGEARGLAKGEARGLAMGRVEGEGKSLMRLLERRFGTLSDEDRERIANANLEQLGRWLDRVLDAESLSAVFVDG